MATIYGYIRTSRNRVAGTTGSDPESQAHLRLTAAFLMARSAGAGTPIFPNYGQRARPQVAGIIPTEGGV